MAGDLYLNDVYITIVEAEEQNQIGPGQFLQCAKVLHTVWGIWEGFPAKPKESAVLNTTLDPGSSRGLISRIYRALKSDRQTSAMGAREPWNRDLEDPLSEGEWKRVCVQVKDTASKSRFKLDSVLLCAPSLPNATAD